MREIGKIWIFYCEIQCKEPHCSCYRTFITLKLAFGKTIDTYQGQSAGPVDNAKPPNAVQRIIFDPGKRSFEGQNVGLFYTIFSHATTLGDDSFMNSAIYFLGNNMDKARITDITMGSNNKPYANVINRTQWVQYLSQKSSR